ncbi:MAG: TIGR03619 family F420-dependent LLM class oxidoreductase [Anaerolineales bacterium]|nr:TIGR03619 family F420-dependent LLM class oxidoreductase [Anaerolineales bacterium]
MDFGITLPSYGLQVDPAAILDTALAAEEYGFHSAWTTDHILLPEQDAANFRVLYESITTLAYIAGQTDRLRLGISSLVLPMRDPILTARQLAALDVLSGGRAMLCVSVGWSEGEYRNLGQDFTNRGARLDEAITVMRLLWNSSGEPVSFVGTFYHFERSIFNPVPLQTGGPELWIGGNSRAARKRALRTGAVWHPSSLHLDVFQSGAAEYHALSKPGTPVGIAPRLRVTFGKQDPAAHLSGSPEEIITRLKQYREAGLTAAVLSFNASSQAQRRSFMKDFMKTIPPAFRGA